MAEIQQELVPEALQKHWAFHGARLQKKVSYKGHSIYLAEGGPHHDCKNHRIVKYDPGPGELIESDKWMKKGYYVSAWALQKGPAIIGFPLYFKLDHDLNHSPKQRAKLRIGSAQYAAEQAIDAMISVGLLEYYEGSILMVH